MAQPFTPTPEPEGIGTYIPVYREDGTVKGAIFVPIVPVCPGCEADNCPPKKRRFS